MEKKQTVKLMGLWENEDKQGQIYLSGTLGNARVLVFRNGFKKPGDNSPDWVVQLAPQEKKPEKKPEPNREDIEGDLPF